MLLAGWRVLACAAVFAALLASCHAQQARADGDHRVGRTVKTAAGLGRLDLVNGPLARVAAMGGHPFYGGKMQVTPSSLRRAAFFMPFNVSYGGGESVFLQTVASLQRVGLAVDVIMLRQATCTSVPCLKTIAHGLRVSVKLDAVRVHTVDDHDDVERRFGGRYAVFFVMGNEKMPSVPGVGLINLFVCQFPFDLDRNVEARRVDALKTYTYVLVYSSFVHKWYTQFTYDVLASTALTGSTVPHIDVLHPAVQPFAVDTKAVATPQQRQHITMLGRFFEGGHCKRQDLGVEIFRRLQGTIPAGTKLFLVGHVSKGHDVYLHKVKSLATGLDVEFVLDASDKTVEAILRTSKVLWHLSGARGSDANPSEYEHFGIAVLEAMQVGCIPVVWNKGGLVDIVEHTKNGYIASSPDDVIHATQRLLDPGQAVWDTMSLQAVARARAFAPSVFTNSVRRLLAKASHEVLHRQALDANGPLWQVGEHVFSFAQTAVHSAVVIETRLHYALRFAVVNAWRKLPKTWDLHILHGASNARFVELALPDFRNVHFAPVDGVTDYMSQQRYHALLRDRTFWTRFHGDSVLVMQTDAVILRPIVDTFLRKGDIVTGEQDASAFVKAGTGSTRSPTNRIVAFSGEESGQLTLWKRDAALIDTDPAITTDVDLSASTRGDQTTTRPASRVVSPLFCRTQARGPYNEHDALPPFAMQRLWHNVDNVTLFEHWMFYAQ